ncbi:MAG TPA: hypothetical protein VK400_15540 [Pyrinomonadaceae bacterium]|nr:hypothetical protein [Pyrinomonadaceae bacterium]
MSSENWRKKKRSAEGFIKTIKGNLYSRLQYIDETGKRREKLCRADSRTTAGRLIKEMSKELENHGEETLQSDKLTFRELVAKYEKAKLTVATYENGIKISGKRSLLPSKSALKPLTEFFGIANQPQKGSFTRQFLF